MRSAYEGFVRDRVRMSDDAAVEACLIVKDEAVNLPKCLASLAQLRPALRAVNVYDTGSTDDTVDIATAAGCRVQRGFWDGDFSRARNASLDMATSPWVLIVDADEEVVADRDRVKEALELASQIDVLNASLTHVDDQGRVIGWSSYGALLRVETVRYLGRIHEVPMRVDGHPTRTHDLPEDALFFVHSGYATSSIRAAKAARNTSIAEVNVQEAIRSGDLLRIGEAHYHLARSRARLEPDSSAVVEGYREAWTAFPAGSAGRDRVMAGLVPELLRRGRISEAADAVRGHLAASGSTVLGRWLIAQVAMAQKQHALALSTLDGIPVEGDPEAEVDPRDVLALRMRVLDAMGRGDEAFVCCLLLVARWGVTPWIPELLLRMAGQEARAVAALLNEAAGGRAPVDVVTALGSGPDDFGRHVAGYLL